MNKPKIFISYSHKDKELIDQIRTQLLALDYSILSDHKIEIGQDFSTAIFEQIKQADYYLIFLSADYLASNTASSEFNRILGYSQSNSTKTTLPILIKPTLLPSDISKFLYLNCVNEKPTVIAKKILETIEKVEGQRVAEKEKVAERIEKINISIVDYVEPILKDLKEREDKLRKVAHTWNFFGYIAIVLGILASGVIQNFAFFSYL